MNYPPNSHKAATEAPQAEPKRVERVTSAEAKRRKKGLGKRFQETFVGGSPRDALEYMIADVMIPAAKDALVEAVTSGFEKLVHGDSRGTRRAPTTGGYSGLGHIAYNRMGQQQTAASQTGAAGQRMLSRSARARHNFDEIIIANRKDAEEVIDSMWAILAQYNSVSVSDLYELTGIQGSHTDVRWGWRDLRGSKVAKIRTGGFLLELPEPQPL